MERAYLVVDAFATQPFTGNPAAVVIDAAGLRDEEMQSIAAEFNLSETTFVLPPLNRRPKTNGRNESSGPGAADGEPSFRFRWFTPMNEVAMCGHATVAGVHALLEAGRIGAGESHGSIEVHIETQSGWLTAFVEDMPNEPGARMIWLELLPPVLSEPRLDMHEWCSALGIGLERIDPELPPRQTQDEDLIIFVQDVTVVNDAKPDFGRLASLCRQCRVRGLCLATVHTLTPLVHVQSRFFAPAAGINEDPVTGSVHGPLAAYLAERGLAPSRQGVTAMTCVQAKAGARAGLLHALVRRPADGQFSVRIGGRAVTTMRGVLTA